jgi:hypothetical protein
MKTLFVTLIAAIALTHAAHAAGWMWFHGDIGLSLPFASSGSPANSATAGVVTKSKVVTKRQAASNRSVVKSKSKLTNAITLTNR